MQIFCKNGTFLPHLRESFILLMFGHGKTLQTKCEDVVLFRDYKNLWFPKNQLNVHLLENRMEDGRLCFGSGFTSFVLHV